MQKFLIVGWESQPVIRRGWRCNVRLKRRLEPIEDDIDLRKELFAAGTVEGHSAVGCVVIGLFGRRTVGGMGHLGGALVQTELEVLHERSQIRFAVIGFGRVLAGFGAGIEQFACAVTLLIRR